MKHKYFFSLYMFPLNYRNTFESLEELKKAARLPLVTKFYGLTIYTIIARDFSFIKHNSYVQLHLNLVNYGLLHPCITHKRRTILIINCSWCSVRVTSEFHTTEISQHIWGTTGTNSHVCFEHSVHVQMFPFACKLIQSQTFNSKNFTYNNYYTASKDFIKHFSKRATGFHRWAKRFELYFFLKNLSSRWSHQVGKITVTAGQFILCLARNENPELVIKLYFSWLSSKKLTHKVNNWNLLPHILQSLTWLWSLDERHVNYVNNSFMNILIGDMWLAETE